MKWILLLPFVLFAATIGLHLSDHDQAAIYTGGCGLLLLIIFIVFIVLLLRAGFGKEGDNDYR